MLINWGLEYLAHKQRLSLFHSTVLIGRVTSLMSGLHLAQILVWAAFYRWMCFPGSPDNMAEPGPRRSGDRRAHVWAFGESRVRRRDGALSIELCRPHRT